MLIAVTLRPFNVQCKVDGMFVHPKIGQKMDDLSNCDTLPHCIFYSIQGCDILSNSDLDFFRFLLRFLPLRDCSKRFMAYKETVAQRFSVPCVP
jgi:hypothetical protein